MWIRRQGRSCRLVGQGEECRFPLKYKGELLKHLKVELLGSDIYFKCSVLCEEWTRKRQEEN
jgi:hypothetical protein